VRRSLLFAAGKRKSNTSGRKSKDRQIAQGYYEQERAKIKKSSTWKTNDYTLPGVRKQTEIKFISAKN